MMSRSRSPSPQDPLSDDDSSDDAELASLASSLARGGGWRSSLLWRVACRVASFVFRPVRELFFLLSWVVWLFSSITIGGGQVSIVLYSAVRITISLLLYLLVFVSFQVHETLDVAYTRLLCWSQRHVPKSERIRRKKIALEEATSLDRWQRTALELDKLCGHSAWKAASHGADCDYKLLRSVSADLQKFRMEANWRGLLFHLTNILHRKFCNIHNEALYAHCYHGTKFAIESFYCNVVEQLSFIATTDFGPEFATRAKLRFFQRARRTLGKTVLCLSGGGALAMYHSGVCRALIKGNCLPSLINGTSGGAIIAALVGTRTDDELRNTDFLSASICTRYGAENRWLPTLQQQVDQFIRNRVLMDHRVFSRSAQVIFGETLTFEEAYRRTQRELCITVTWSSRSGAGKPHPLVLNHISSPNVYIWSAVTASCALPGLMAAQSLKCRGPDGLPTDFTESSGAQVVDGSLQADIPVQRLTELFNAQCFIVSQTNPHVRDFVRSGSEGRGTGVPVDMSASPASSASASSSSSSVPASLSASSSRSLFGPHSRVSSLLLGFEKFLQADIGHRLKRLAKLKVIPKIYGQDFRHVISATQQYTGDVNIVPRIPFLMRFKALTHPSEDDMREYFRGGEVATFPKISRIQNGLVLERTLEECVRLLTKQKEREQGKRSKRQQHRTTQPHTQQQPQQPQQQQPTQAVPPPAAASMAEHQKDATVAAHSPVLRPLASSSSSSSSASSVAAAATAPVPAPVAVASPPRSRPSRASGAPTLPAALSASSRRCFSTPASLLSLSAAQLHSIHTPTSVVLSQLPMHGALDATDTEAERGGEEDSPASGSPVAGSGDTAGSSEASRAFASPRAIAHAAPAAAAAAASSSLRVSESGADDAGFESDEFDSDYSDRSSTCGFDAEEAANQELTDQAMHNEREISEHDSSSSSSSSSSRGQSRRESEEPVHRHAAATLADTAALIPSAVAPAALELPVAVVAAAAAPLSAAPS